MFGKKKRKSVDEEESRKFTLNIGEVIWSIVILSLFVWPNNLATIIIMDSLLILYIFIEFIIVKVFKNKNVNLHKIRISCRVIFVLIYAGVFLLILL